MLDIVGLRAELEKILADVGSEDFAELKLNEWENYEFELNDHLTQIKDEVQSLISSSTAYLKEDKSELQGEVLKVAQQAKKLRSEVDETLKELVAFRKSSLSLTGIIETHCKMVKTEIQLDDSFRSLR
jgi:predicted RNase H-like nuclease (RuvC/YqgF family)